MLKKSIFTAIIICTGMILSACSNRDLKSTDNNEVSQPDNSKNEKNSLQIEVVKDYEQNEKGEEMNGELFYDLGAKSLDKANDSCFMQPILQNPTDNGVTVQWFTENEGEKNLLYLYDEMTEEIAEDAQPDRIIEAKTIKLSRVRGGKTENDKDDPQKTCDIYKHVAIVDDLPEYHGYVNERRPYKIVTDDSASDIYTLAARPLKGTPLRILLTSDHQIKDMVAANIQKVYETVGNVDGVFFNGDLVDVSDRGYDWFYADNAFFRCMSGTAKDAVNGKEYFGAPILQQAPMYTSIGNHDVMGVYDTSTSLSTQFNEPRTRQQAENKWNALSDDAKSKESHDDFVQNHSYNTITTEEIFENPESSAGREKYYAVSFGDIRLITLDISRVWRLPNIGLGGKYSEIPGSSSNDFAEGDFIFESIKEGSAQVNFLDEELAKSEYKDAKIKMVMFHSEAHSLGGNQIPAFTDPVPKTIISPYTGQEMVLYDYPIEKDYINKVIEPRLEKSGTNLLFEAHSHLWNRFKTPNGMNILETSNVGNSYGGFNVGGKTREQYPSAFNESDQYYAIANEWNRENYCLEGDPYGLEAILPNMAELPDRKPYLDSNTITAFSILDTAKGTIDSYYFDTEKPDSDVVLFDSFSIASP